MTITEKVAYLKGLAEGMKVKESSDEGKLMLAVIDTLEDIALTIEDLDDGMNELSSQIDEIDEDLSVLEDDFYDEEDNEDIYEVECPSCGDVICINEEMLEDGEMNCPNCGELLEFDLDVEGCSCCGDDD